MLKNCENTDEHNQGPALIQLEIPIFSRAPWILPIPRSPGAFSLATSFRGFLRASKKRRARVSVAKPIKTFAGPKVILQVGIAWE